MKDKIIEILNTEHSVDSDLLRFDVPSWQADQILSLIKTRLLEIIEPPKEWKNCLKVAFGQDEICMTCGFNPNNLKQILEEELQ